MAFAGPRLIPTITTICTNVVRLSYLFKAFTLWMCNHVRNVDGRLELSIFFAVVNHSPHSYTFRCLIEHNCIPHQLSRWISHLLLVKKKKSYGVLFLDSAITARTVYTSDLVAPCCSTEGCNAIHHFMPSCCFYQLISKFSLFPDLLMYIIILSQISRWSTHSHKITEVKQGRNWSVLIWVSIWK